MVKSCAGCWQALTVCDVTDVAIYLWNDSSRVSSWWLKNLELQLDVIFSGLFYIHSPIDKSEGWVSWIQGNSKAVIWPTNRAVTWVTSTWPVLISKHTCIHTVHAVILDISLHTSQVAHQARAYPSLSSMKWVGVFLLPSPPSWMGCNSITGLPPSSGVERTNHEANSIIFKWLQ